MLNFCHLFFVTSFSQIFIHQLSSHSSFAVIHIYQALWVSLPDCSAWIFLTFFQVLQFAFSSKLQHQTLIYIRVWGPKNSLNAQNDCELFNWRLNSEENISNR